MKTVAFEKKRKNADNKTVGEVLEPVMKPHTTLRTAYALPAALLVRQVVVTLTNLLTQVTQPLAALLRAISGKALPQSASPAMAATDRAVEAAAVEAVEAPAAEAAPAEAAAPAAEAAPAEAAAPAAE